VKVIKYVHFCSLACSAFFLDICLVLNERYLVKLFAMKDIFVLAKPNSTEEVVPWLT
jgi:hypothetical protein